jgi:hypothetical protein
LRARRSSGATRFTIFILPSLRPVCTGLHRYPKEASTSARMDGRQHWR